MVTMRVINVLVTLLKPNANPTQTITHTKGTKQAHTVADTPTISPTLIVPFASQGASLESMNLIVLVTMIVSVVQVHMIVAITVIVVVMKK